MDWKKIDGPVTIYDGRHRRRTFNSLSDFVKSNWYSTIDRFTIHPPIGVMEYDSKDKKFFYWCNVFGHGSLQLLDEHGLPIPPWRIRQEHDQIGGYETIKRSWWKKYEDYSPTGGKFRNGPVPNTHGGGWNYNTRNRMHTTAERRENDFAENFDEDIAEYRIRIRTKRNMKNLPSDWDDRGRSDYRIKSWKRHRSTQYKT